MTELEQRALSALCRCSMRIASAGKIFRNDIYDRALGRDYKLTERQALYLWNLVYTYRRQISDVELVRYGEHVQTTGTLPAIYQPGDHAEAKRPIPKEPRTRAVSEKPSRYQAEIERGGGRLAL